MRHCCQRMEEMVSFQCDQHPDPHDCPDFLLVYIPKWDEYGLVIHNYAGGGQIRIYYCPFCGKKLPESKRDE